jgi:hypothetical protein
VSVSLIPRGGRVAVARRVASVGAAIVVLVGAGSCSSVDPGAGASTGGSLATGAAEASAARALSPADRAAVLDLLRRRAAAVVARDEQAYAATVADPSGAAGQRQLAAFGAARALRVSRLEVALPVDQPRGSATTPIPPSGGTRGPVRGMTGRVEADVRYRVDDLDTVDRTARVAVDLVAAAGARWAVVAEEPLGAGAAPPWLAMPDLRVRRGRHAVVAGSTPTARLDELAGVADDTLPSLRAQWSGTPGRVLVLAPASVEEADALLGRSASVGPSVAATTEGPTGSDGRATGDRIVLDPTAYARLTRSGREVVLRHELAHVAVRSTVPGRPAAWLAEGYADHVGHARADVPDTRLLAPLLARIRAGHLPSALPGLDELQPASGDIQVPYLAAWQAVELLVEEHGEDAVRRLVTAGASTGSDADVEAATDAALESVLGTSRAELTRTWRQRLRDLAG